MGAAPEPLISLQGRRVALVGGAGFIGHHLALALKREGAQVEVIDGLAVNNLAALCSSDNDIPHRALYLDFVNQRLAMLREAGIPLHVLDARDYNTLCVLFNKIRPQVLIHLAAVAHAGKSNKDPFSTFDHSLRTLENSLDIARSGVEHFVYFSSSMVYGHFRGKSVTEESHCDPLGIYGALKFAGEKMVIAYHQVFGLPYTIVRPSALYGERCISRRVAQVWVENAHRNAPLKALGDGGDRLDFTYVQDLVQGVLKALQTPAAKNQIFNLTCGQGRSLKELMAIIAARHPRAQMIFEPRPDLMPERGTLSVEKARRLLGYAPAFPLEKGLAQYMDWYDTLAHHPDLRPAP